MERKKVIPPLFDNDPVNAVLVLDSARKRAYCNRALQRIGGLEPTVSLDELTSKAGKDKAETFRQWLLGRGNGTPYLDLYLEDVHYRLTRYTDPGTGFISIYYQDYSSFDTLTYQLKEYAEGVVNNTVGLEITQRKLETRNRELQEELRARQLAEELLKQSLDNQKRIINEMIRTLSFIGIIKDPYTGTHQQRVAELAKKIAEDMDLHEEQIQGIYTAGMLHDIGKISIPSEILSKPGHINDIELLLIRSHPSLSFEILKQVEFPWPVARIAYQHHEKLDGSGYPEGIKGDDILLEAQIICVADVVEAISSHRPYRAGLGVISAMEYITEKKGSEFLDEVVDSCIKILDNGKYEFGEDQLPVIL
jgi:putative nucleotidyltransferase with HDIG domain